MKVQRTRAPHIHTGCLQPHPSTTRSASQRRVHTHAAARSQQNSDMSSPSSAKLRPSAADSLLSPPPAAAAGPDADADPNPCVVAGSLSLTLACRPERRRCRRHRHQQYRHHGNG